MRKEQVLDLLAWFGVTVPVTALIFSLLGTPTILFWIGFAIAAVSGVWLTMRLEWMHKNEEELAGRMHVA